MSEQTINTRPQVGTLVKSTVRLTGENFDIPEGTFGEVEGWGVTDTTLRVRFDSGAPYPIVCSLEVTEVVTSPTCKRCGVYMASRSDGQCIKCWGVFGEYREPETKQGAIPAEARTKAIFEFIRAELVYQDKKWGSNRILPPEKWITILGEEFGEVCRAALEQDKSGYVSELVDVAATAISAIQSALLDPGK